MRKIIHIDMDAFYASVEQRDFPELRGKCIAVGGKSKRGVLMTASYEARKFGVKSAMPTSMGIQRCPELIVVPPRFTVYREVSQQIRSIFRRYTDIIEPLSLDEAYLDVTVNHKNNPVATYLAQEIKADILKETGLTASAGVSFNKFLAKIASDYQKPNGLFVIKPKMADEIIGGLPIERFHGIGRVTAEKMKFFGIHNGYDLKQKSKEWLCGQFGKAGIYFYEIAHGEDHRPVEAFRQRKSVSVENTFLDDLTELKDMEEALKPMTEEVWDWVLDKQIYGRTITVKLKFNDFSVVTRSNTSQGPIKDYEYFIQTAFELLASGFQADKPVRLLGVGLSNLVDPDDQQTSQLELKF